MSAQQLSFSSYPGELFSDDDFYITSSNMVVLETTNHIYNFTILQVRAGMLWLPHSMQGVLRTLLQDRCCPVAESQPRL